MKYVFAVVVALSLIIASVWAVDSDYTNQTVIGADQVLNIKDGGRLASGGSTLSTLRVGEKDAILSITVATVPGVLPGDWAIGSADGTTSIALSCITATTDWLILRFPSDQATTRSVSYISGRVR